MNEEYLDGRDLADVCGRSWVEVDLDRAADNLRWVKNQLSPGTGVCAIVKTNAYGHGAPELAACFLEAGAEMLAVACLDEVMQLRRAGITSSILILSDGEPERHAEGIEADATYSLFSLAKARDLSERAVALGRKVKVHVKVDTGMRRVGFSATAAETPGQILELAALPGLDVEGIFTHFATADGFDQAESLEDDLVSEPGEQFLQLQFRDFVRLLDTLEREGLRFRYRHCCNSPATLRHPEMHLDLVRPGLTLYGLLPDNVGREEADNRPILSLHSRALQVRTIEQGQSVSYGRRFVATTDMRSATVPIGYGDGYRRSLTGKAEVLVHGRRVPVLGTICMDSLIIDVSKVGDAFFEGDRVVLWGEQGGAEITIEEVAAWSDTINYEVPCALSPRLPRVYLRDGKPFKVVRYLV